jgi:hypothetical protein
MRYEVFKQSMKRTAILDVTFCFPVEVEQHLEEYLASITGVE